MRHMLTIHATDSYPLEAIAFEPSEQSKGVILVCPGLGIPKEYYEAYCHFLSEQGYVTLVFDYRGIGAAHLITENHEVNLRNWGIHDIPGVLDYLSNKYPLLKIYMIGHSIGGQITGLMYNHRLVERYIFISSTGGHWSLFDFPLSLFTWFMFNIHIPVAVRLFGHLPKSLTYRGRRIAKGVALEWAAWSRRKDYIAAFFGEEIEHNYYKDVRQNIDWIWFADDAIATDQAVASMMDYYENATITKHGFDPKSLGWGRVGHAGFFNSRMVEQLWRYPLDIIEGLPSSISNFDY